ncbi:MAG TPA: GAF domain-containing protein [Anaerolineales bacterium]|nr:GAF domain-containing protein [Anaerolineales bacterium]
MKILYVEDEIAHVILAQRTLEENIHQQFNLIHAETIVEALRLLEADRDIDLVLSDLRLPDGTGLDLLKKIREQDLAPAVVLVTGQGDQEVAVAALKAGAADYLVKQSDYLHRLPVVISNAIAQNRLLREQEALRQAEVKYQALVEQIAAVVFLDNVDDSETTLYISPRIEELTGYTAAEWYSQPDLWVSLLHPDDRERVMEHDKHSHDSGTRFIEEYRLIKRDGSIVWIKEDTNLILDKNGVPLYQQGILLDITKEKETIELITKSEERFRRIFHASPIATCVVRADYGKFIDANQSYLKLVGKSFDELTRQPSMEVSLWRDEWSHEPFVEHLKKNGAIQGIEHQYLNVPGGPRDTLAYFELIELGGQTCVLAMFYDVTEEKKAQKALQAERDFALQVLNNMGQGLTVTAKDGQFEYVNPAYADIVGYKPEEILGKTPSDFTSGKKVGDSATPYKHGATATYESTLLHKDTHEVPALITEVPRQDENTVTGTIAVITDLTDRKKAEEELAYQVEELTILHSVAIAEAESVSEEEIIERVTKIIGHIYQELCGFLLLNEKGDCLTPHPSYLGVKLPGWQASFPISVGITGMAVTQDKIIRIGDVKREPEYIEIASGVEAELCIPIRVNGRVIGVLDVESKIPDAFDEDDERFLNTIANSVGTALERLRLFKEEQRRRQEAENLRQAATAMSSSLDPDHVLAEILNALNQVIHYDNSSVFLQEGEWLRLAVCHGFPESENYIGLRFPADDALFQQIKETRRPVIIENAQKDPRFKNWGNAAEVRGWMSVPLITRGRVMGYITLDNYQPGAYDEGIFETAMAFANQAAAALENARLFHEQSQRSKIIETLADIANEIATTRDVSSALDQITQRALDLLNANDVAIYLVQDDNVTLKTVSAYGFYRKELLSHTRKAGDGITGNVFLNGRPEIINDTSEDPRRVIVPGTPEKEDKLESLMSSPLILRGKTIGVINAWRLKENGLFDDSELNFLVGIAHQVSICIESGRLFQETSRQAQEAAAIAEVGRDISATLQLDVVMERIASYAMNLLHAETSAVYLADASTSTLRAIAALGKESAEIKDDPLLLGAGILGNIALQNVGEIVNDTANDPRSIIVKGTQEEPFEHIMGVPILLKEKHTGLLAIWRSGIGTDFTSRELDFLTSLARQAAVAIENARLYDETQRRIKELEIINRVSTSMRVAQSMNEMLPILLNEAMALLNTPHGSIWMYDHSSNMLVQKIPHGVATKIAHSSLSPVDGIVGRTFTSGTRYVATDLKNDPMLFNLNRESVLPGLTGIFIPIQSTAGPVGVLTTAIDKDRQLSEEINLLSIIAEITGNSIHRVQLYEQSQMQVRRLTTLRDIDAAITSSFDLRLTLNILMDQTMNHLNVDAVDIGLYQPDIQGLTYLASAGFQTPAPTRPQMRLGEGLAGQVIVRQSILHVTDLQNALEARNELLIRREGFVTYIGIPLIVKGQIKGVFEVFHRSPLSPTLDWMEFLHTLAGQAAIAIDGSQLFESLQRSNQELIQAYDTTLEGWARALELRDRETEGHTRRVTELTLRLARYMGVSDSELVNIHRGVLLHDIGKMGVPDHILKKKGKLNDEEWKEMRMHPIYAYNLLSPISYLRNALDIPYCHHEHWNGGGYPGGLKGEQIPLSARIFSVVDIWDALLTDRPYRKAWPENKVINYIKEVAGTILDPHVVDVFFRMLAGDKKQTG